jgi:predicted PurR-regulated permease PerM
MDHGVRSSTERRPSTPRTLVALSLAGVFLLAFVFASSVFFTILAGVLFAICLRAPSEWMCRRFGWPTHVGLAVVTVLLLAATAIGTALLGSFLVAQVETLFEQLPQALASVRSKIAHVPWARAIVNLLAPSSAPSEVTPNKVVAGATNVLSGTFELVVALVAVFFIGLYGAAEPRAYSRALLAIVPPERRDRARDVLEEIRTNLSRWIVGRIVAMASVAVITTVGLVLAKVPLPIPLGILAGVFTFVEYLGAVVSAIPAVLVALGQGPTSALWVVVVFTVAHVIEGYLLTPALTRGTVRFPPAFTLAVQLLLGAFFGVAGLTFATPLAVVGTVVVKKLYVEDHLADKARSPS